VGPDTPENAPVTDAESAPLEKAAPRAEAASPDEPSGEAARARPPRRRRRSVVYGLLERAIVLSLAFGAVHLLGFRAYTAMLSGTGSIALTHRLFGAAYLLLHACFVFLVPTLLLAAALLRAFELATTRRKK